MPRTCRYECTGCGATRSEARSGKRTLWACQTCDAVTSWERLDEQEQEVTA